MAPRSKTLCQICSTNQPKYTCSKCYIAYCSVPCYKNHQRATALQTDHRPQTNLTFSLPESTCGINPTGQITENHTKERSTAFPANDGTSTAAQPLVPDEEPTSIAQSDGPSELDIDRPKQLRSLTSLKWPYVPEESAFPDPLKRDDPKDLQLNQYEAIATSSQIREILSKHENLPALLTSIDKLRGTEREGALHKALGVTPPDIDDWRKPKEVSEDVLALRELAEAVEAAIRGGNETALGLNWGDES